MNTPSPLMMPRCKQKGAEVPISLPVKSFAYSTSSSGKVVNNWDAVANDLPTHDELIVWYECLRKIKYPDAVVAESFDKSNRTEPYKCPHCGYFHNGRLSVSSKHSKRTTSNSSLVKQWKKRIKKPTVEELRLWIEAPAKYGKFFGDDVFSSE